MLSFPSPMRLKPTAFTLIELLIVVAIIAILAAIAVPNFLEAQTRAKTSRAKADMRTVATALESYRVDNNRYMLAYNPNVPAPNLPLNPRIRRLIPLTTPIAYIASLPLDVFNQETAASSPSANSDVEVRQFIYVDRASYEQYIPNPYGPGSNGLNLYRNLWGPNGQLTSAEWLLRSRGPLGTGTAADLSNLGNNVDLNTVYDPTNGTLSNGNIFMFGPGIGFPNQN